MMGRLKSDQGQLFYEFHLGDAVPEDHLVRKTLTTTGTLVNGGTTLIYLSSEKA